MKEAILFGTLKYIDALIISTSVRFVLFLGYVY